MYNIMEMLTSSVTVLRRTTVIKPCKTVQSVTLYKEQSVFLQKAFSLLRNGWEGEKDQNKNNPPLPPN